MIEIGPCSINAIEQHNASFHLERSAVGFPPYAWYAWLKFAAGRKVVAHGATIQHALDSLELRIARQPESDGVSA